MVNLPVLDLNKNKLSDVQVPEALVQSEVRKDLLQTVVRWQLACRRSGTVATKTKGLVSGGGKKPFKQKGTGNARQGSSRSPLMPGGGTAFGPQPRDYSYVLPRKIKQMGLSVALSYLHSQQRLLIVDSLSSDGKTATMAKALNGLGLTKALICDEGRDVKVKRAVRNLRHFKHVSIGGINVFDLLKYDACVLTKGAVAVLAERLGGNNVI